MALKREVSWEKWHVNVITTRSEQGGMYKRVLYLQVATAPPFKVARVALENTIY